MRIIFALLAIASLSFARETAPAPHRVSKPIFVSAPADPPKPADPNAPVFILGDSGVALPQSPNTPAAPVKLSIRRFTWIRINDASYTGPVTLDGSDNPAISVYVVKPGQKYPSWKEGDDRSAEYVAPDSKNEVLMICGEAAGIVKLTAWGVVDGKPKKLAMLTLNVGGAPPVNPVLPTDFQVKLQAAFEQDMANGGTLVNVKNLAALYRGAATTTVQDAGLTTSGALLDEMARAVQNLKIPHKSLDNTVRVLVDAGKSKLPVISSPLDQATRDNIAAQFTTMAAALEGLK